MTTKDPTNLGEAASELLEILQRCREKAPRREEKPCTCGGSGYVLASAGAEWKASVCPCRERCPACDGDGLVYSTDEQGYEYANPCPECGSVRDSVDAINRASLPSGHDPRASRPRTPEQKRLFRVLKSWVSSYASGSKGWLLSGPPGVGKSFALIAVLRQLSERGLATVRYEECSSLLSTMRLAMDDPKSSPDGVLRAVVEVEVLGLDELPRALSTEWQQRTLEDLLLRRYQAGRTTLATTNHDEDSLADLFGGGVWGERVVSRMAEWMPIIEVGGSDLRRSER